LDLEEVTQLSSLRNLSIDGGWIALPAAISGLTTLTCLRVHAKVEGGQLPALANLQQLQELQWPVASEERLQQLQQQLSQLRSLRTIYLWADKPFVYPLADSPEMVALEALLRAVNTDGGDGSNMLIPGEDPTHLPYQSMRSFLHSAG
jgi:hypothetical protein